MKNTTKKCLRRLYRKLKYKFKKQKKLFKILLVFSVFLLLFYFICALTKQNKDLPTSANEIESDATQGTDIINETASSLDIGNNETDENGNVITKEDTDFEQGEGNTLSLEEKINFNATHPYLIKVNIATNRVIIYGINYADVYSIPYKVFVCSVGREGQETPTGTYELYQRYDWCRMVDNSYSQYAIRFNGSIMFHSVPYYYLSKDSLETEEFNKLGSAASLGCVRLSVEDVKWIYDNCIDGTVVDVYEDADEELEIEASEPIRIPEDSEYAGWDPTDPDPDNPWHNLEN
ncbi:MAG: L,D-transpeptidase [Eubacterium sp.]